MGRLLRLTWLELKLLVREPLTVVLSLLLPLIILFVLGGVFGNEPTMPGDDVVYRGVGPMSFYVPAYLALVVASVCTISLPTHLAGNRERGVLKRLRASSVSAAIVAGAELGVAFVLSAVSSLLLVVAAFLAYDPEPPGSLLGVLGVFVVTVVGFAAIGILLGAVAPTARAAQAAGLLLWFVMLMLGGAGPPPRGDDRHHGAGGRAHPPVARRAPHAAAVAEPRSGIVVVGLRCRGRGLRRSRSPLLPLGVTDPAVGRPRREGPFDPVAAPTPGR